MFVTDHWIIDIELFPSRPQENKLLSRLPRRQREQFIDACDVVDLKLEQILSRADAAISHVYFPTGSFISQITPGEKSGLEVALVGDEGMFGLPIALGIDTSPVTGMVQGAGPALRMSAKNFRTHLKKNEPLRRQVAAFTYVQMAHIAQTALCNRYHRVEQRLARWLLMTSDRAHSLTFRVTHAFLALMLGVRRVGVTTAASGLQGRGLIGYTRGNLTILDRQGLEAICCACYGRSLKSYQKTFR
jgi:CRP-like cAMP-binding protein